MLRAQFKELGGSEYLWLVWRRILRDFSQVWEDKDVIKGEEAVRWMAQCDSGIA